MFSRRWVRIVVALALANAGACAGPDTACAQVIEPRPPRFADQWVWSGGVFGGVPLGDFKAHEDGGFGVEVMAGFQPWRRQPLVIRSQFASLFYGSVDETGYQDVCDIFGCRTETVRYHARNHTMTSLHIGPEIFATDGTVRPFAYALHGITFFHSSANVQPTSPGGPSEGSATLFSSHNASADYGAGVRLVRKRFGREFGIEIAARVTRNPDARYLTEDGVVHGTDGVYYITPRQSDADVLGLHISFWMGPFINWNERRGP